LFISAIITKPNKIFNIMLKKKRRFVLAFSCFLILLPFYSFSQSLKLLKTIVVDAGHGGTDGGATGNYENSIHSREKDITLAISKKLVAELKKQLPDVNIVPTRTTDIYQNPREKADIANQAKGDLFICIHADAVNLKNGHRLIGTKKVTRYRVKYSGKGKKRKKISTPYQVTVPVYEYYKIPTTRQGTSVWIFAAHKTSDKLKAIMKDEGDFDIQSDEDSTYNNFDFNTPEGRVLAQIYAKRYQEKSDKLATYVNDEIEATGRPALGVNQRQKGIWVLQATNMPAILVETGFISNPQDEKYLNSEKGQQEIADAITKAVIRYKQQIEATSGKK
jgi:N-acetylmuramoyl-L-alanine amidase